MSNVFVVEADSRSRERIARFLREDLHSVTEFGDAAEALAAIDQRVELLVVGWGPAGGMSAAKLLLHLKQQGVKFPILVANRAVTLEVLTRVRAVGARDLLRKPVDQKRLRRSVVNSLEAQPQASDLVKCLRTRVVGKSPVFLEAVDRLAQAIESDDTAVLLIGESGVGKEIFARLIHEESHQDNQPLEAINLAGLSSNLIESELFGHEKGAFTGADRQHQGAFERAKHGTLFLDEIGYLAPHLQPKLLRVIQERTFLRVGGREPLPFRAQLVCATSRNLAAAVKTRAFRQDLYYRINEFEIRLPPLRDHREDVRLLARHFLNKEVVLEEETIEVLMSYSFPGNVRELKNILKQAQAVCRGDRILPGDLPGEIMHERETPLGEGFYQWPESLFSVERDKALKIIERQFDREYLTRVLQETGGNKTKAAERMGISRKTLRGKLQECQLEDVEIHEAEEGEPS